MAVQGTAPTRASTAKGRDGTFQDVARQRVKTNEVNGLELQWQSSAGKLASG